MVVAKLFAKKGPERLIFPALDIAGRPVIHQNEPKNMVARLGRSGWARPRRLPSSDNSPEFHLIVELLSGPEAAFAQLTRKDGEHRCR